MQKILQVLENQKNWKQFLKKACRKNKVTVEIASYFTPLKMKSVYQRFEKIYDQEDQKSKSCWLQNQLKAFYWTIICISGQEQSLIENFSSAQWIRLNQIFRNKNESIMEYEAIKLVNQKRSKNRAWQQEQIEILANIINQNKDSNKWNDTARMLFQQSKNRYFRSGKQCRERWLNHLDPTKKKQPFTNERGEWTLQEDIFIAKHILTQGKRWSTIAKQLGSHRTEHMVKNRYKTMIIRQKKTQTKVVSQNNLLRQFLRGLNQQVQQIKIKKKENQANISFQAGEQKILDQRQEQQEQGGSQEREEVQIINLLSIPSKRSNNIHITDKSIKLREDCQMDEKKSQLKSEIMTDNRYDNDPVISGLVQQYQNPMQQSNYQLQQICSPWYINYQGMTPNYFSPSPSLPFFLTSSFSAQENPNLFLKGSNTKNDQKQQANKF